MSLEIAKLEYDANGLEPYISEKTQAVKSF